MSETTSQLQKSTVVLRLRFRKPGATRKGSLADVDVDAEKDSLRLRKEVIRSEHYNAVWNACHHAKKMLRSYSLPSPFEDGTYLLPTHTIPVVYERLEGNQVEFNTAADKLVDSWDDVVADAKKRLRNQFRAEDFPSKDGLRSSFRMEWQLLKFETPGTDAGLSDALYDVERQKAELIWKEAEQEVTAALRVGLSEVVNKLVSSLEPKADGGKKRLFESTVESLSTFLQTFSDRNVLGDKQLQDLVAKAKKVVNGQTVEGLRTNEAARQSVQQGLSQVATKLDKLIVDQKRVIKFKKKGI